MYINAGELDTRLEVLQLTEKAPKQWEWAAVRRPWGKVTLETSSRKNLFSSIGIGARDATIVLRRQELTMHHALRAGGQHLFVTAIVPQGRGHLKVSAALVSVETVTLRPDGARAGAAFPGVLTEKYLRHGQEWPMSVNDLEMALVVPKAVTLRPGRLVEARGAAWEVLVPYELDEYKNEYVIGRRAEL